jgi:hypothetical protein
LRKRRVIGTRRFYFPGSDPDVKKWAGDTSKMVQKTFGTGQANSEQAQVTNSVWLITTRHVSAGRAVLFWRSCLSDGNYLGVDAQSHFDTQRLVPGGGEWRQI